MALLRGVWCVLRLLLLSRSQLVMENLALRQQLAVLRRSVRRPRLRLWDRLFWVWLSRWWIGWKNALASPRLPPLLALEIAGAPGPAAH